MHDETIHWQQVEAAFSKQSVHFDEDDRANPILQQWRQKIYDHVDSLLKPNSRILELNAGTGIDAIRFASKGHFVYATDISEGMVAQIRQKISKYSLDENIYVRQISFEKINQIEEKFDFVFSNFGGLNCIEDLKKVTRHLPKLLNANGIVTCVIMPKIAPWEWTWALKGKLKEAFRRFKTKGATAKLEGEVFTTFYHSWSEIKISLGSDFELLKSEGLGIFAAPPSALNFNSRFPVLNRYLNIWDKYLCKKFPFNRWGDHIIIAFRYQPTSP
ncbi:MAG: methyltransferase domain-containing protein [Bacteroidetes bacterium]|nr:methyltransferase domain-containing protein [Bacteroidota bacterium]